MTQWNARYLANDTPWDRGAPSPFLLHHLTRFKSEQKVLVPGCGTGHEVLALAAAGHRVTALDIAPEAVNRCQARLAAAGLTANVIQTDVLTWQPKDRFDMVYEQTCLCAQPPQQWEAYASQLASWVAPGRELWALFMQTDSPDGPPYHCALERMREIFAATQWHWPTEAPARLDRASGRYELGFILHHRH